MHEAVRLAWMGWWSAAALVLVISAVMLRRRTSDRRSLVRAAAAMLGLMVAASVMVPVPLMAMRLTYTPSDVRSAAATAVNWHASGMLGAWLLFAALLLVVVYAVGDPARGRRRCPRCWYELGNAVTAACPECGRSITSERQVARTRRTHRLLLAAALLAILSVPAWLLRDLRRGTWPRQLPIPMLIAVASLGPDNGAATQQFLQWVSGLEREVPAGTQRRLIRSTLWWAMRDEGGCPSRAGCAAMTCAYIGADAVPLLPRLLELMHTQQHSLVVAHVILRNPDLAEHALPWFAERSPMGEMASTILQGWRGRFEAPRPILELAASPSAPERAEAIALLGYARADPATIRAVTAHQADPDETIRCAALEAICRLDPATEAAVTARVRALGDPSERIRESAARLIGRHGPFDGGTLTNVLAVQEHAEAMVHEIGMAGHTTGGRLEALVAALERPGLVEVVARATMELGECGLVAARAEELANKIAAEGEAERAEHLRNAATRLREH